MAGHFPILDKKALLKLRALVKRIQAESGSSVQLPKLLELANSFSEDTGLTVDFDATKDLGQPLLVVRSVSTPQYPDWADLLSPREKEVVELLAAGFPNKSIAARLFISLATVKDHVHNILVKSGLPSRYALAAKWPTGKSLETSKP